MVRLEKDSDIAYYGQRAFMNGRGYSPLPQDGERRAADVGNLLAGEVVGLVNFRSQTIAAGELLPRLTPPGFERFLQSPQFVATFGGAEANVAVALAGWGLPSAFVTVLPEK